MIYTISDFIRLTFYLFIFYKMYFIKKKKTLYAGVYSIRPGIGLWECSNEIISIRRVTLSNIYGGRTQREGISHPSQLKFQRLKI